MNNLEEIVRLDQELGLYGNKRPPKDKRKAIQRVLHEIDLLESEIQRKLKVGLDISQTTRDLKVLEAYYEEMTK